MDKGATKSPFAEKNKDIKIISITEEQVIKSEEQEIASKYEVEELIGKSEITATLHILLNRKNELKLIKAVLAVIRAHILVILYVRYTQ